MFASQHAATHNKSAGCMLAYKFLGLFKMTAFKSQESNAKLKEINKLGCANFSWKTFPIISRLKYWSHQTTKEFKKSVLFNETTGNLEYLVAHIKFVWISISFRILPASFLYSLSFQCDLKAFVLLEIWRYSSSYCHANVCTFWRIKFIVNLF